MHLEQLCGVARGPARRELLDMGARFTEFAGWLYQDAGDSRSALYWTNRAMDYAHELGDTRLSSYVLMRKSNIETDAGHVAQGLGLAAAALRPWSDLTPGLRALALRQKAYAYALAGEREECVAAIETARSEVDSVVATNEPSITAYCSPSFIEMESAHSWARLGRTELAAEVYSRSLTLWPDSQRRDQALCTARLANTFATLGEVDKAASYGRTAAGLVRRSPSARTLATLRATAANVALYRKLDCVKEFQHSVEGLI
jgi:tetratricopeptide (TPR) repeat protein